MNGQQSLRQPQAVQLVAEEEEAESRPEQRPPPLLVEEGEYPPLFEQCFTWVTDRDRDRERVPTRRVMPPVVLLRASVPEALLELIY